MSRYNSSGIINAMVSGLRSHLSVISGIIVEGYYIEPARMEEGGDLERQDIPVARVSVYEDGDDPRIVVDRMQALTTGQRYGIDINYRIGFKQDRQGVAENPMLELKDEVIEWVTDTDIYTLTGGKLNYLQYLGSLSPNRNVRYTTIKLNLTADRNLNT